MKYKKTKDGSFLVSQEVRDYKVLINPKMCSCNSFKVKNRGELCEHLEFLIKSLDQEDFIDCCSICGNNKYSKYKPFREIKAITMSEERCVLCNGENINKKSPIIYARYWSKMCR